MANRSFENQVVFITGASSGIGKALSIEFARQGARVALAARREDRLRDLVKRIEEHGGQAIALRCDVTRDGDLELAVSKTLEKFGRLDVAVANAGFGVAGRIDTLTLEDFRKQMETNFFGLLRTVFASLPSLKKSRGRLVLLGSVAGHVALPGSSPYAASKFCVRGFAQSIVHELRPEGVSVTLISPGFVDSEIRKVDNEGVYQPGAPDPIPAWIRVPAAKAARDIVRAVHKRKAEEVITAHGKAIVWIQRHFPWFVDFVKLQGLKGRPEPKTQP